MQNHEVVITNFMQQVFSAFVQRPFVMLKPKATIVAAKQDLCWFGACYFSLTYYRGGIIQSVM